MSDCNTNARGQTCPSPSTWDTCRPWELVNDNAQCYIDSVAAEQLQIGGATVNVYKLLGVHEQTSLMNLVGTGAAISGGDSPGYSASFAFDMRDTEWRSKQHTAHDIYTNAYIGYDFGEIKLANGRQRYGIEAPLLKHITTIKIKQSSDPARRATKARVERSDDGVKWRGVAAITLPNDDALNTISFKQSVPSRFWRIRPTLLAAETDCSSWAVKAIEMHDYAVTRLDNIQDKVLMENRTRDYAQEPITLKGFYELNSAPSEFLRMTLEMTEQTYNIRVHFNTCVAAIGRPVVIGDIIELPSETQYSASMQPVLKWLEVTDVMWDTSSYTPGWQPTMLSITAQSAMATEETQDIFGDLAARVDSSGVFDKDDGNNPMWQDLSVIDQAIQAESKTKVPELGSEGSNTIREFTEDEIRRGAATGAKHLSRMNFNRTGLYVEDAMPQNGAFYTEGPDLPTTGKDGDYHRLTYAGLAKDVPPRLYRYSATKSRWIYLETDRRQQFNRQKAVMSEYLSSPNAKPAEDVK